jgi:hypothetical protein
MQQVPAYSVHSLFISQSMLCVQDFLKRRHLLTKKSTLQIYIEFRLQASFCKVYGHYNDLFHDYRLSMGDILVKTSNPPLNENLLS